jgi:hypothetical protein
MRTKVLYEAGFKINFKSCYLFVSGNQNNHITLRLCQDINDTLVILYV